VEFVIDDSFNAGSALFLNLTRETSTLLASVERNFSSRRGDRVYVEFNPSSCNVYDRDSGNIIGQDAGRKAYNETVKQEIGEDQYPSVRINRYFSPLQMIYLEKLVS
jgi:hypothetical protein